MFVLQQNFNSPASVQCAHGRLKTKSSKSKQDEREYSHPRRIYIAEQLPCVRAERQGHRITQTQCR